MWYLWFLIIPATILFCFFDNLIEYKRMTRFKNLYLEYHMNTNKKFSEYKDLTVRLLKKANIDDSRIPISQSLGYNQIANMGASIFNNCLLNDKRFVSAFIDNLESAIGIFRYRMLSSLNPIKWIETIIFLPKSISTYFNFKNTTVVNIFQILYWIASIALIIYQIINLTSSTT